MIAQLREYTKNHWIIYFKWINCIACELYFNKADTYTHSWYHLERNKQTSFFSSEIYESQREITKDLKYVILLKLIVIILVDETEDGMKYRSVKLSIAQHICWRHAMRPHDIKAWTLLYSLMSF